MMRQFQLFMTRGDEEDFFSALRFRRPQVAVIDGQVWPTPEPPVRSTMADCSSFQAYIWDRAAVRHLPNEPRLGGGFQGPTTGGVVQWLRCRQKDGSLHSGSLAVGAFNPAVIAFVVEVWKVLRKFTTSDLVTLGGDPAPEYRIGPDAHRWADDDPYRLRHYNVYFMPKERFLAWKERQTT